MNLSNLPVLPEQFVGQVAGRTLIYDGDGACYTASATRKTIAGAIKRFKEIVLTELILTGSERATLHLTAQDSLKSGRFKVIGVQPYQQQRSTSSKPPLLEALRQAVANRETWLPEYDVSYSHRYEADDTMMMQAYQLKENGLIWSEDKDLRMTPYPYWEAKTGKVVVADGFGSLFLSYTDGGAGKCLGYGKKFFWAQMLMGDQADHIKGIIKYANKLCGYAGAFKILDGIPDERTAANTVIDGYRAINQNPIPEGWLLWMLRYEGDSFWQYCQEIEWTPANNEFLQDCVRRAWFKG